MGRKNSNKNVTFKTNVEDKRNMKKHVNCGNKCKQCDNRLKIKPDVKKHNNDVHESIPFKCDVCGFKDANNLKLKEHYNCKHTDKDYLSQQRVFKLKEPDNLRSHDNEVTL